MGGVEESRGPPFCRGPPLYSGITINTGLPLYERASTLQKVSSLSGACSWQSDKDTGTYSQEAPGSKKEGWCWLVRGPWFLGFLWILCASNMILANLLAWSGPWFHPRASWNPKGGVGICISSSPLAKSMHPAISQILPSKTITWCGYHLSVFTLWHHQDLLKPCNDATWYLSPCYNNARDIWHNMHFSILQPNDAFYTQAMFTLSH